MALQSKKNMQTLELIVQKRLSTTVTPTEKTAAGRHVLPVPSQCPAQHVMNFIPVGGGRKRNRQETWKSTVREDLQQIDIKLCEDEETAAERV